MTVCKKSILLTRSIEENREISGIFENIGLIPVFCPLLEYKTLEFDCAALENYSDIILSSKRASCVVAPLLSDKTQNLWIVGKSSLQFFRSRKNKNIRIFEDFELLEKSIAGKDFKDFLYLSSNFISKEPPEGMRRIVVYETLYAKKIDEIFLKEMEPGVDYISLFSENCAKTFIELAKNYNLLEKLRNSYIIAISSKVAEIAKPYFNKVSYPKNKNLEGMVELIIEHEKNDS